MKQTKKLDNWWQRHALSRSANVVVALSGGRDSTLLLTLLQQLHLQNRIGVVYAAWFDHRLRPEHEILQEEKMVRFNCSSMEIPLSIGRADPQQMQSLIAMHGMEAAARIMRYTFLQGVCRQYDASLLAVAHHQDDQVETVIMRLAGGSTIEGLAGISPQRDLADGLELIRPLSDWTSDEIATASASISYHEDSTNYDTSIRRNAVRSKAIPVLRDIFPALGTSVQRAAADIRETVAWLQDFLPAFLHEIPLPGRCGVQISNEAFCSLPGSIRCLYLMRLQNRLCPDSFGRIPRSVFHPLAELETRDISTTSRIFAGVGLEIYQQREIIAIVTIRAVSRRWSLRVEAIPSPGERISLPNGASLDPEDVHGPGFRMPLFLRSPVAGDTLSKGKTLKSWFQRNGVPSYLRNVHTVIENQGGYISAILDPAGRLLWKDSAV